MSARSENAGPASEALACSLYPSDDDLNDALRKPKSLNLPFVSDNLFSKPGENTAGRPVLIFNSS